MGRPELRLGDGRKLRHGLRSVDPRLGCIAGPWCVALEVGIAAVHEVRPRSDKLRRQRALPRRELMRDSQWPAVPVREQELDIDRMGRTVAEAELWKIPRRAAVA